MLDVKPTPRGIVTTPRRPSPDLCARGGDSSQVARRYIGSTTANALEVFGRTPVISHRIHASGHEEVFLPDLQARTARPNHNEEIEPRTAHHPT
jgi:hypothetical protein